MKKMLIILLALGLGISMTMFTVGCGDDEGDSTPTEEAPTAPTSVQAGLIAPTLVRVTWVGSTIASVAHVEGYAIQRRVAEGTYSEIGSVSSETLTYDDSSATRGVTYQYRVGAYNEGGTTYSESAPSVTTPTYQESLVGYWMDTNAQTQVGIDTVIFQFYDNDMFRRTDIYDDFLDTEVWDEGFYQAGATSIEFHVLATDTGAVDYTYTWEYELSYDADAMSVQTEYEGSAPTWVDFVKAAPASNQ